jgi:hypothetical protein
MQTMPAIAVKGKVIGQTRPPFPDWSVPLPPELWASGQLTLRDLISRIVLAEVEAFRERQVVRGLTRVLSGPEIERDATLGRIAPSVQDSAQAGQSADPQAALDNALLAFEDRLYYVFIDDVQGESLDQPVRVRPGSAVTFLRLVPLAGG